MSERNGFGAEGEAMPEGAVLLTEAIWESTSRQWVKLPYLSARVATMTTAELLAGRLLTPVSAWSESERAEAARLAAPPDNEPVAVDEAALLEARARQVRERGVVVEIQAVGLAEALGMQPVIPGQEDWPTAPEQRIEAFKAWFDGLDEAGKTSHREQQTEAHYQFLAAGLLRPKLSLAQLRRFKDDGLYLALAISRLSGLDRMPEPRPPAPPLVKTDSPLPRPAEPAATD